MNILIQIYRTILPPDIRIQLARARSRGNRYECPVCERQFGRFWPSGEAAHTLRDNSLCPHCKSLERHRLLWLYIRQHPHLFAGSPKVLHIAPEKIFTDLIRSFPGVDYLSADLNSPLAMVSMDITDIHYPENTFDAILCCHVLEHIPDDGRAMRELHRVLKPGGWAILQVPLELDRPHTYEDPMITDPAEREKHFNQRDHVRIYGRDYVHRLEASGFHVRQDDFGKAMPPALADRYRIDPNEPIFFCTKANAAS